MNGWTLLAIIGSAGSTVCANLLLKIGAGRPVTPWLMGLMSWESLAGACCFGIALPFYMQVVRQVPLNVAQGLIAVQFALGILAAAFILGETIPTVRWLGFGLITLGILLVTLTIAEG